MKPGDIRALYIGKDGGVLLTYDARSLGEHHRLTPEARRIFLEDLKAIMAKAVGKEDG